MENSYIDLIIRIKNGYMARRESIISPFSNFRVEVLVLLKRLAYIKDYKVSGDKIKKIDIELLYTNNDPVLTGVKIVSKPGQREYVSYKDLKPVLGGMGKAVLSTPKGILTNSQARREKVGGELLFYIW